MLGEWNHFHSHLKFQKDWSNMYSLTQNHIDTARKELIELGTHDICRHCPYHVCFRDIFKNPTVFLVGITELIIVESHADLVLPEAVRNDIMHFSVNNTNSVQPRDFEFPGLDKFLEENPQYKRI